MSYFTPLALNAAASAGRSSLSQRTEDLVSGRMTPTNAFRPFADPPAGFESHAPRTSVATVPATMARVIRFLTLDSFRVPNAHTACGGLRGGSAGGGAGIQAEGGDAAGADAIWPLRVRVRGANS